jgi:hypothetical protein
MQEAGVKSYRHYTSCDVGACQSGFTRQHDARRRTDWTKTVHGGGGQQTVYRCPRRMFPWGVLVHVVKGRATRWRSSKDARQQQLWLVAAKAPARKVQL